MPRQHSRPGIADVVERVVQRIDGDKRLRVYRLWAFWDEEIGELVGEAVAARAKPHSYRDGILSVRVSSHVSMQELHFAKLDLIRRLNERLGTEAIRDIYFVSVPGEAPLQASVTESDDEEVVDPGPALAALPSIKDPRLAAVFERIVGAHARRSARRKRSPR